MTHPYTIHLPIFEGPLDLLLRLIEQRTLDITAIALAEVADQYLAQVRAMEQRDPAQISEFLLLAAKLLLIKSRALLPRPVPAPPPEEDVGEQLARQLREYQAFKRLAEELRTTESAGQRSYGRGAAPDLPILPTPPLEHGVADLIAAVNRRLQLALPLAEETATLPRPRELTVSEVALRIVDLLQTQAFVHFEDLLGLAVTRAELVVTLWATLELWKRQAIEVEQAALFAAIFLTRGPAFDTAHELIVAAPSAPSL